jgi:hypothetical protein
VEAYASGIAGISAAGKWYCVNKKNGIFFVDPLKKFV